MSPQTAFVPAWKTAGRRPRLVVLGVGDRPLVREQATRMRPVLNQLADIVLEDLASSLDLSQVDADFALVLGGDGSILRAAKPTLVSCHNQSFVTWIRSFLRMFGTGISQQTYTKYTQCNE